MPSPSKSATPVESNGFRPKMERLEEREVPAAFGLFDFYNVRAGQILDQTQPNAFGVAGVLRNDIDTTNFPFSGRGLRAVLVSPPVDFFTGLPAAGNFTLASNGGFRLLGPQNSGFFSGSYSFRYQAIARDGSVSGITTAFINVTTPVRRVAVGADRGASPTVAVFDAATNNTLFALNAFDAGFTGGVRVAVGDFNNDAVDDIACAAGTGAGPHVKIFDGQTGGQIASFFAFDAGFVGGLEIAVGDLNLDGRDDLIVAAGSGPSAHVKVFDGTRVAVGGFDPNAATNVLASFFAYGSGETDGVRVAVGDIDGNGALKLITAPAFGSTLVKAFDVSGGNAIQTKAFFAGDPADARGLFVTAGDLNGDRFADIVVGSGSGTPEARIYVASADPTSMALERSIAVSGFDASFVADAFTNPLITTATPNFFTGSLTPPTAKPADFIGVASRSAGTVRGGLRVAVTQADNDRYGDLVLGQGPNGFPRVQILSGLDLATLTDFTLFGGFFGGLNVAGHF